MWPRRKNPVIPYDPEGVEKICPICRITYRDYSKSRNKQTCSPKCYRLWVSQTAPGKAFERKLYMRLNNFKRKGITWSPEEEIILRQKLIVGKCEICGETKTLEHLDIDHNHTTNKLRGVLCDRCNLILGSIRENTEYLQAMITYLQTSP